MVETLPGISSLFLLKSTILYLGLVPPPLCLTVILPLEFLPACFFRVTVRDFSGLSAVISSNVDTVIPLSPGEVGLYFLIPILPTSYYRFSKNSMGLLSAESVITAFL